MNFWNDVFRERGSLRADETFISDPSSLLGFKKYDLETTRLLECLRENGLSPGDRVLVTVPRGVSLAAVCGTLLRGSMPGMTIAPVDVAASLEKVQKILKPRALIGLATDPRFSQNSKTGGIPFQFAVDGTKSELRIVFENEHGPRSPADLGWILQTSGSTSQPKLVMISKADLLARASGEVRDFEITSHDHILNFLSFSHDLGLNQLLVALVSGARLGIQNQPFISSLAASLETGITGITGTPLVWTQLLHFLGKQNRRSFHALRYFTISGGSLPAETRVELKKIFPNATMIRTYGQTETFRSLIKIDGTSDDLGRPLCDVNLSLKADGELVHSGVGTMMGYYGGPTTTSIETGDLFEIDPSENFRYLGRKDDMIKRFEHRLHLSEVESAIASFPSIRECIALSRPAPENDLRMNLVRVFVRADANGADEATLMTHCKKILPSYKVPDAIRVLSLLPVTSSQKIDRRKLLEEWIKDDASESEHL